MYQNEMCAVSNEPSLFLEAILLRGCSREKCYNTEFYSNRVLVFVSYFIAADVIVRMRSCAVSIYAFAAL